MADRQQADKKKTKGQTAVDTLRTHTMLGLFAFGNALCEEVVSRGLSLSALAAQYGRPPGAKGWMAVGTAHML